MPSMVLTTSSGVVNGVSPKRARPPKLSLGINDNRILPKSPRTIIDQSPSPVDAVTPVLSNGGNGTDADEEGDVYSSPSSTSSLFSGTLGIASDASSDDLTKDLAELERLRRDVQKNLRLRPLRSTASLREAASSSSSMTVATSSNHSSEQRPSSPSSSADSVDSPSIYYTPSTELNPFPISARFVGPSFAFFSEPSPKSPIVARTVARGQHQCVDVDKLFSRLSGPRLPLLIDTRTAASYNESRLVHSLNIAIPSLIMRRSKKPGGGFSSLDALQIYITTDEGKRNWNVLMGPGGNWDGDVIVYDENMDEKDRDNPQSLAWSLLSLIAPLLDRGSVAYLKGGVAAARAHSTAHRYLKYGVDEPGDSSSENRNDNLGSPPRVGLFQLVTQPSSHTKPRLELDPPDHSSSNSSTPSPLSAPGNMLLMDYSPSPSPSSLTFSPAYQARKMSTPNLGRIDTSSAERLLPKLHVRTGPVKSNSLAAPLNLSHHSSTSSLRPPPSPSYLNLSHSKDRPTPFRSMSTPTSSRESSPPRSATFHNGFPSSPRVPTTPMGFPTTPMTARPDDQPPTTEEPLPVFTVSCILPNFLFLGPELTSTEHVEELQSLGIKRILNVAIECDDDLGLNLRDKFERYMRIPMRDTVEEENVAVSVKEACKFLDDARLHSTPTYVHCKAGKSRSVTAVIAYLIHANHWTLSQAYAFVVERRKGISPNIGFVSELMTFEEQELGNKSVGVINSASATVGSGVEGDDGEGSSKGSGYGFMAAARRSGHMRESLPPAFLPQQVSDPSVPHGTVLSVGPPAAEVVGDSAQETEIKDASGRYRHLRRAPVNESTLQPMRRVSKAGLESALSEIGL